MCVDWTVLSFEAHRLETPEKFSGLKIVVILACHLTRSACYARVHVEEKTFFFHLFSP